MIDSEKRCGDYSLEEMRRVSNAVRFTRPALGPGRHSYPANKIGIIYFIGPEGGPVKIGFTASLRVRLGGLQVGSPVPLKILATLRDQPSSVERDYHERFSHLRLHGEWFILDHELQAEIDGLAEVQRRAE